MTKFGQNLQFLSNLIMRNNLTFVFLILRNYLNTKPSNPNLYGCLLVILDSFEIKNHPTGASTFQKQISECLIRYY